MAETIFRDVHYTYTLREGNGEMLVKLVEGVFATESNVLPGTCHPTLGLSYDALKSRFENDGEGPHSHIVKVKVGTTDVISRPLGEDKPSR